MMEAFDYLEESEVVEDINLSAPQFDFVHCEGKYPAILGGLGSGKTQAGISRALMLMDYEGGCWIGYYMPTYDLINLRAMPGIEEWCTLQDIPFSSNKSKYYIDLEGLGRIIFRSYEKPQRIIAYQTAHAIVDELDTLEKEKARMVWRKVNERNRAPCAWPAGNTIANVTTPDQGDLGFSYERWGRNPDPDHILIPAPTSSIKPVADYDVEEYIKSIRKEYDPVMADAMIEGKFVSFNKNKVYHFFSRKRHHTDRKLKIKDKLLYAGIDFNIGGCAATLWVIENNKPVGVGEFVAHDTRDFVNRLDQYKKHGRKITVTPDASGGNETTNATSSDIAIIRNAGYSVKVDALNPAIRDRINSVNGCLAHDNFLINTDEMPLTTDALESQGYDKTTGKPQKFDDHPSIDDWNDSTGYFINQMFPVSKQALTTNLRMGVG